MKSAAYRYFSLLHQHGEAIKSVQVLSPLSREFKPPPPIASGGTVTVALLPNHSKSHNLLLLMALSNLLETVLSSALLSPQNFMI